jgi:hypothetical protein
MFSIYMNTIKLLAQTHSDLSTNFPKKMLQIRGKKGKGKNVWTWGVEGCLERKAVVFQREHRYHHTLREDDGPMLLETLLIGQRPDIEEDTSQSSPFH